MRFIAEIGSNYFTNGKTIERAFLLIEAAARSGATDVKFQLFEAGTLYRDPPDDVAGIQLPRQWVPDLHGKCKEVGVNFLCTPFDLGGVSFLNEFVNEWKIASWDITYVPLLESISKTKKPVILSTAAATIQEIELALSYLRPNQNLTGITLMHCHSSYPTPPDTPAKLL